MLYRWNLNMLITIQSRAMLGGSTIIRLSTQRTKLISHWDTQHKEPQHIETHNARTCNTLVCVSMCCGSQRVVGIFGVSLMDPQLIETHNTRTYNMLRPTTHWNLQLIKGVWNNSKSTDVVSRIILLVEAAYSEGRCPLLGARQFTRNDLHLSGFDWSWLGLSQLALNCITICCVVFMG